MASTMSAKLRPAVFGVSRRLQQRPLLLVSGFHASRKVPAPEGTVVIPNVSGRNDPKPAGKLRIPLISSDSSVQHQTVSEVDAASHTPIISTMHGPSDHVESASGVTSVLEGDNIPEDLLKLQNSTADIDNPSNFFKSDGTSSGGGIGSFFGSLRDNLLEGMPSASSGASSGLESPFSKPESMTEQQQRNALWFLGIGAVWILLA